MTTSSPRLDETLAAIDAANAADPNRTTVGGRDEPLALIDGRRMSAALKRLAPTASEHLQIAVRGHHIERWTSPRQNYPEGRVGYLKWRRDLAAFHAKRLAEIMSATGYGAEDAARVGAIVRKEKLDSDAETQIFEDTVCIVFLEHGLPAFMTKTDDEKLARILAKTWKKMSDAGHQQALALDLPADVHQLLARGLASLTTPRVAT